MHKTNIASICGRESRARTKKEVAVYMICSSRFGKGRREGVTQKGNIHSSAASDSGAVTVEESNPETKKENRGGGARY